MATLFGMFPFLKKLFADGGYQGPEFNQALARVLPHLKAEIVKRSDHAKGFVVLPKRYACRKRSHDAIVFARDAGPDPLKNGCPANLE